MLICIIIFILSIIYFNSQEIETSNIGLFDELANKNTFLVRGQNSGAYVFNNDNFNINVIVSDTHSHFLVELLMNSLEYFYNFGSESNCYQVLSEKGAFTDVNFNKFTTLCKFTLVANNQVSMTISYSNNYTLFDSSYTSEIYNSNAYKIFGSFSYLMNIESSNIFYLSYYINETKTTFNVAEFDDYGIFTNQVIQINTLYDNFPKSEFSALVWDDINKTSIYQRTYISKRNWLETLSLSLGPLSIGYSVLKICFS